MNREYHKWWSPRLGRDMELLVFGKSGPKMLVFPTRGGRFYEYEDMRMIEVLRPKIEAGGLQVFCLDSVDCESFYCHWAHPTGRIERHSQYEDYVVHEVFPLMTAINPHRSVTAHGCSLGAFHAANVAFRHPHLFTRLLAFSGRYDLTLNVEHFRDLFDGYYDEKIYFNTPTHFLPQLGREDHLKHLRQMDILLTVGREDPFRENNEALSDILAGKDVGHQIYLWNERAHRGYYWRRMAEVYLLGR
ncbi:MAG: alpha/beta hydrolase-fold protein [Chthoniobacterales bacterium]